MLSLLFRRIALTGLLLVTFIGTGVLFGPSTAASATRQSEFELTLNLLQKSANVAENTINPSANKRNRVGPDLGWPFFSFSRKGGR